MKFSSKFCTSCGKVYMPSGGNQRKCNVCRQARAERVPQPRPCAICGTQFNPYTGGRPRKYCSAECTQAARRKPDPETPHPAQRTVVDVRECARCGTPFLVYGGAPGQDPAVVAQVRCCSGGCEALLRQAERSAGE